MKTKRSLVLLGVTAALGAVLWWVLRSPAVTAEVGVVRDGPLRRTVDEMGTTRVRAHTDVNAPVAGRW